MTTPAHITVVESVYYQDVNGQPSAYDSRYCRFVQGENKIWQHRLVVGEAWKRLDEWFQEDCEKCSLLLIVNEKPPPSQVQIDEREIARRERAVIDVACYPSQSPLWLVRSGESMRVQPADGVLKTLLLRCREGTASCFVTIFPA